MLMYLFMMPSGNQITQARIIVTGMQKKFQNVEKTLRNSNK